MKDKRANALILTMFIMSGMLIVAMSGAYVVWLGIRSGGIQAQSTKAYYAAETGAEDFLYRLRHQGLQYGSPSSQNLLPKTSLPSGSSYDVYFSEYIPGVTPLIFQSVGDYQNTKRSIEIRIGY